MELLTYIVKGLFVLFLIYTFLYICQWIIGLCVSVYRLSGYQERRKKIEKILPDKLARNLPVSVIIPAYNEEACIGGTIDSLLAEDYPNVEILVVDDGSSDNTIRMIIDKYQMKPMEFEDPQRLRTKPVRVCYKHRFGCKKLILISKENGGKADALNCGLNLCRNAYCVILDADTQVRKGSIRAMTSQFVLDKKTIVCAGAVGDSLYGSDQYKGLSLRRKALVLFQKLEYYRTFYMQRILFDYINANIIVSGAFAMFDAELVKEIGGYKVNTIGEDMELTMRLHAFCMSQKRSYHIAYIPEAGCDTQVPFRYRDYYQQRRRWHIGMIQSLKEHIYMLGSRHYGWAGIMAGTFILFYELFAPFIEVLGLITVLAALGLDILNLKFGLAAGLIYSVLTSLTQWVLIRELCVYGIEKLKGSQTLLLMLTSVMEFLFFHPFNIVIKINAFLTRNHHKRTWKHIKRADDGGQNEQMGRDDKVPL